MRRFLALLVGSLLSSGLFCCPSACALDFLFVDGANLNTLRSTNPQLYTNIREGFASAGDLFAATYDNDITVSLTVDIGPPGFPALMAAGPNGGLVPYSAVAAKLPDLLPALPPAFDLGASLQIVDASQIYLTAAQMAAIGVWDVDQRKTQSDGLIVVSLDNAWDFDPSDGIAPGRFDFVHAALHEIGHGAGFLSSADGLQPERAGEPVTPTLLDMFRYSAPDVRSLAPDLAPKYFSTDGGVTPIAGFAAGVGAGGPQASHWNSIAGPTMSFAFVAGQAGEWSRQDEEAFAAIGWQAAAGKTNAGAPEPNGLMLMLFVVLLLWWRKRKER